MKLEIINKLYSDKFVANVQMNTVKPAVHKIV
jgi:hypothetical protein